MKGGFAVRTAKLLDKVRLGAIKTLAVPFLVVLLRTLASWGSALVLAVRPWHLAYTGAFVLSGPASSFSSLDLSS
jgi:hypothetical protein